MNTLENYRKEIDNLDKEISSLLEKRLDVCINIGKFKKENNVNVLNKNREEDVLKGILACLNNHKYDEALKEIYIKIMEMSRKLQKEEAENE